MGDENNEYDEKQTSSPSTNQSNFFDTFSTGFVTSEDFTKSNETMKISESQWKIIQQFCEQGQMLIKHTSWGNYHRRRVQILNHDTLSWKTNSMFLRNIRHISIGENMRKYRLRRKENGALHIKITSVDRVLWLEFREISHRNFWLKALVIYLSQLPSKEALYVESIDQLREALDLTKMENQHVTVQFSSDGNVRPEIISLDNEFIKSSTSSSNVVIGNEITPNLNEPMIHESSVEIPPHYDEISPSFNEIHKHLDLTTRDLETDTIVTDHKDDTFSFERRTISPSDNVRRHNSIESQSNTEHEDCSLNWNQIKLPSVIVTHYSADMLSKSIVKTDNGTLFIVSTSIGGEIFDENDIHVKKLIQQHSNVLPIHVSWCDGTKQQMCDEDFNLNVKIINQNIRSICDELVSGHYKYISLPREEDKIGSLPGFGNLEYNAPKTFEYVSKMIKELVENIPSVDTYNDNKTTTKTVTLNSDTYRGSVSDSRQKSANWSHRKQALELVGVDEINAMTRMICEKGDKFRTFIPNGSCCIQTILVNSKGTGMIGEDLHIPFENLVSIQTGYHPSFANINCSSTFILEYRISSNTTRSVALESMIDENFETEQQLSKRNWWINSIVSYTASLDYELAKVPQSLSTLRSVLNCKSKSDNNTAKLLFQLISDVALSECRTESVELTQNISVNRRQSTQSRESSSQSLSKAETARKLALLRVRHSRKIHEENMREFEDNDTVESTVYVNSIPENSYSIVQSTHETTKDLSQSLTIEKTVNENPRESISQETIEKLQSLQKYTTSVAAKLEIMEQKQTEQLQKIQELQKSKEEVENQMSAQKRQFKSQMEEKDANNSRLKSELKLLQEKFNGMESNIKVQQWKNIKTLQSRLKKQTTVTSSLEEKLKEKEMSLKRTQNAYEKSKEKMSRNSATITRMRTRENSLKSEFVATTNALKEEMLNTKSHLASIQDENRLLKNQIRRSSQTIKENQMDEIKEFANENERLRRKTNDLTRQVEELQNMQPSDSSALLVEEIDKLKESVLIANQTIAKHQSDLSYYKRKVKKLKDQIKMADERNTAVQDLYKQKLIDFTHYAEEQMKTQEKNIMNKLRIK